jgi:hypothetical protein
MQSACYVVDWPSVEREFPPAITPPRLLAQFAQFLRAQPDGSLGSFAISGDRVCDGAMLGGDDIAECFGLFCGLGDGSQVGFWFPAGTGEASFTEHAPIVLIAHDDAPSLVAPSFTEFLWRIANANVDTTGIPYDFQPDAEDDDIVDARPALQSWLAKIAPREPADAAKEAKLRARFERFMEASISAFERAVGENPLMQQISQILKPYWMVWMDASLLLKQLDTRGLQNASDGLKPHLRPEDHVHLPDFSAEAMDDVMQQMKGHKIPKVELIEISAAGGEVQVTRLDQGKKIPLPESARLVPLILQLREQQVQAAPERGLWHYASLTLGLQGEVSLSRAARAWPQFAAKALVAKSTALVRADLARFPRSVYWQLEAPTS